MFLGSRLCANPAVLGHGQIWTLGGLPGERISVKLRMSQGICYFLYFFYTLHCILQCSKLGHSKKAVKYNVKYKKSIKSNKFPVTFATLLKSSVLGCPKVSRSGHLGQAGGHAERERERECVRISQ